ncbi:MAG: hypothetical protein V1881_02000 [Candidatus Micrarchaeota archaeon]
MNVLKVLLVILAGIVLGLFIVFYFTTFWQPSYFSGNNAREVIPVEFNRVHQRGTGLEVMEHVEFTAASRFYRKDAIGESAVSESNLEFYCDDATICGDESSPLTVTSERITVNKKIAGAIAVCTGDGSKYYAVIAAKGLDASSEAKAKCNLG